VVAVVDCDNGDKIDTGCHNCFTELYRRSADTTKYVYSHVSLYSNAVAAIGMNLLQC